MDGLDFKTAFKYPFNRAVGLLNILWFLVPIIGWFALCGYSIRIVKHFTKGDFTELPEFDFTGNLKLGFFMVLKAIPFMIAINVVQMILAFIPLIGAVASLLIFILIVPILTVNFFNKETIGSYFELSKVKPVFENLAEYITAFLKTIVLVMIFFVMIVVLVGFPAGCFTGYIFYADFYRRYVK